MNMLSWTEILKLYEKLIRKFGGTYGIRDENLLKSAIDTAFQTFDGKELYPSITEKIATICYSIIKNHPMVDFCNAQGTSKH